MATRALTPLRILIWHEIVNDEVGGTPVTVTYCPLCNSAIVFDRRVPAHVLDFGTTGKLRNSDLVMYDRQTESWWQQFTGEAIVGSLTGTELKLIPSRLEFFGEFRTRHPGGKVLIPNNPELRTTGATPMSATTWRPRRSCTAATIPRTWKRWHASSSCDRRRVRSAQ